MNTILKCTRYGTFKLNLYDVYSYKFLNISIFQISFKFSVLAQQFECVDNMKYESSLNQTDNYQQSELLMWS